MLLSLSIYCSLLYTSILCLPPPPLSLSIVLCCIHLSVPTSSSSLSNYLSIYPFFYVVHIYLYLPPSPPLYRTISLSIYCSMLYTSICTYLFLLLSIELSIYLSIVLFCTHLSVSTSSSSLSIELSLYLSIVLCCIHLSVPTSSSLSIYCSMLYTSTCTYLSVAVQVKRFQLQKTWTAGL